jgi:hypothetical protein
MNAVCLEKNHGKPNRRNWIAYLACQNIQQIQREKAFKTNKRRRRAYLSCVKLSQYF